MAASVRVEGDALTDPRFARLGKLLGSNADEALGKMIRVWSYCTTINAHSLPPEDVDALVAREGFSGLALEVGLAEAQENGAIRICGTKGRIEWLAKLRRNSEKGGNATRAKWGPTEGQVGANRGPSGPHLAGAKRGPKEGPPTLTLPPALVPAPTQSIPEETLSRSGISTGPVLPIAPGTAENAEAANPHAAPFEGTEAMPGASNGTPARTPTKAERLKAEAPQVTAAYVTFLNERLATKYEARADVQKLVRRLLERGHTLLEMQAVAMLCRKEWADKPDMAKYLRPSTLLTAEKFGERLDRARVMWPARLGTRTTGEVASDE